MKTKLTKDNKVIREDRVKYTIKDGTIYDANTLLQEVKEIMTIGFLAYT